MQKYNKSGIIKTKVENENWQRYLKNSKRLEECTARGKHNEYQAITKADRRLVLKAIDAFPRQTFICKQIKVRLSMQKLVYILNLLADEKKITRYSVTSRGVRYKKLENIGGKK